MYFYHIVLAIAAGASLASAATRPKANEYKSSDCSGDLNYGHNSFGLDSVTMDDTSNSVYLTTGRNPDNTPRGGWYAYDGHEHADGGLCSGNGLSKLPDGCIDLNPANSKRIRCVSEGG